VPVRHGPSCDRIKAVTVLEKINAKLPIIAHEDLVESDCCGCVIVEANGPDRMKLVCNECRMVFMTTYSTLLLEFIALISASALKAKVARDA
jgi:hypothetical protein